MMSTTTLAVLCAVLLAASALASDAPTVWDVLEEYGLPRGLLPATISNFTLREQDRFFTVNLPSQCKIQFADLVYYDAKITGYLSFGSIKELTGIRAKKWWWFFPLSVTAVELDYANQQLEFKVWLWSPNYPIADFATVKECQKNGLFSSAGACRGGSSCRGIGSFFLPEVLALPLRVSQA